MARQPERSQFDKGFYRYALGQGIGFGQGDEAEAYLRSKISGRPYEESLDRVRREMANYQKQYPRTSSIAEFGGALTPSVLLALTGVGAGPAAVNTLKNVGTFKLIHKKKRIGRNPKTKEEFLISSRKSVSFTVSKKISEKVGKLI